ncbi:uncharacterized protein LOC110985441 [Acanthaster planci]|uniref:Uncharacterized protein LOC110985441 n=1 Tax=Acanthaster planci TaxID=133434 RepID=A0A8B7ZBF9_ACAPL|nr:uncharacterized protein LOC110985441 [Acanthaster planci]
MSILSVVFLCQAFLAISYAQKKCCYPDQFVSIEGIEIGLSQSGKGSATVGKIQVAFDYTNKRVAELGIMTTDQKSEELQGIADYSKGVQYFIQPKARECIKVPLAGPMPHCVPDNATSVGSIYLGNHKLTVDVYNLPVDEGIVSLSVTHGECIPNSYTVLATSPYGKFKQFFQTGSIKNMSQRYRSQ